LVVFRDEIDAACPQQIVALGAKSRAELVIIVSPAFLHPSTDVGEQYWAIVRRVKQDLPVAEDLKSCQLISPVTREFSRLPDISTEVCQKYRNFLHFYSGAFSAPKSNFGTEYAKFRRFLVSLMKSHKVAPLPPPADTIR
jgi:hypothetical protein